MNPGLLDRLQRLTLVVAVLVLLPIGASYALDPAHWLPRLMRVSVDSVDTANTMRSVGGFIFAFVALFALGAARQGLRRPALLALLCFTGGLSLGRIASLVLDGMPSTVPMIYLMLEASTALTVIVLLRLRPARP